MAAPKTYRLDAGPSTGGYAVTPSDVTILSQPIRALYVGGGGDLTVEMRNPETVGGTLLLKAVPTGTMLPLSVARVLATGTTATSINAFR